MTEKEWNLIRHKEIFDRNYRGEMLLTPIVIKNTSIEIAWFFDRLQDFIEHRNPKAKIVFHCLWENGGHVKSSKHYLGIAGDFHVDGMSYKDAYEAIHAFLIDGNLYENVGWGLYPDWNFPGFHIDTRGSKARWGEVRKVYYGGTNGFNKALTHALIKFDTGRRSR